MCQFKISELSPGLLLASDITYKSVQLFEKDTILTEEVINKLRSIFKEDIYVNVYSFREIKPKISTDGVAATNYINFILSHLTSALNVQLRDCNEVVNLSNRLTDYLIKNRDVLQELIMIKYMHNYTYSHCLNVAVISSQIGVNLGLTEKEIRALVLGSLLHDLGKTAIPTSILDKPTKLSDAEFNIIKEHPEEGYKLLSNVELDKSSFDIIIQHHEKLDGSGYPNNLVSKGINPLSKIVAVSDIFDAVTSERSYHKPLQAYSAVDLLQKDVNNKKLDSIVVDVLKKSVVLFPLNTYVSLSNGISGYVVGYSDDNVSPVIYDIVKKKTYNISKIFNVEVENVG